jgi:hypothetical protein
MNEKELFLENVIDIKFMNGQVYMLKKIDWTTEKLIRQIEIMPYSGEKRIKENSVENAKLPYVVPIFYYYIFNMDRIPSEEELFNEYINIYMDKDENGNLIVKNKLREQYCKEKLSFEGVKARVLRTYPSLIRDFHFYLLCCESNKFEKVLYSMRTDIYDGIDLIIHYKNEKFGVSLFTSTKRAKIYKDKKYNRHDYNAINEITLKVDLWNCTNRAGKFILFDISHLNDIVEQMEYRIREKLKK